MPGLSIECEMRGCNFTTPELDHSFYPSMVSQLQIHHSSIHTEAARAEATHRSMMTTGDLVPLTCLQEPARDPGAVVDEMLAESSQVTPEKKRQEEQGRGGEEGGLSYSEEKLGSTSKGMRKVRVSLRKPKLGLQFLCTECNLCSFNTDKGLKQHKYRWCNKEMSSTEMFQNPVDAQNNNTNTDIRSLKDKVDEKNSSKTTNLQLGKSSPEHLECPDCHEKSYPTPRGLTMHRRTFCRNRRSGIFCLICNETFLHRTRLSWHTKKYGGKCKLNKSVESKKLGSSQEQLECPDCQEKGYSTPRGLTLHRRSFCKNRRTGIFCLICNEAFLNKTRLSKHTQKYGGNCKLNRSVKPTKSKNKQDISVTKNQVHNTECVSDEDSPEAKVMITVEFTSEELKKSTLRWKVPVLAPIQRVLEKVCDKLSLQTRLLLFTWLGKEVNPGDLAGQYGGMVIQAGVRGEEMTVHLDIDQEESEEM